MPGQTLSRLVQSTRDVAESFNAQFGPRRGRSLKAAGAACIGSACVGMGKLIMGLVSLSLFTCVSAFYSFAMVVAKVFALSGLARESERDAQLRYCVLAGVLLITASILYMLYSVRLIWHPVERGYSLYIALGIATFTFAELGLNIRGVLAERRNHTPLFYALKTINLASALIGLVMTQRVLLALGQDGSTALVHARANVLMGILMGLLATLLGVSLIARMRRIRRRGQ